MRILKQILVCLSVSLISTAEYSCSSSHRPAMKPDSENIPKTQQKLAPSSNANNLEAQGNTEKKEEEQDGTIESSKNKASAGIEKGPKTAVTKDSDQNTSQGSKAEGKSKDVDQGSKTKDSTTEGDDETGGEDQVPTKNGLEKNHAKKTDSASLNQTGNSNSTLYPKTKDIPPKREINDDPSIQDQAPMNHGSENHHAKEKNSDNSESSFQQHPDQQHPDQIEETVSLESGSLESGSDETVKKNKVSIGQRMNNAGRQLGKKGQEVLQKTDNGVHSVGTVLGAVVSAPWNAAKPYLTDKKPPKI
ncbi:hypothetical protein [Cardinium endosymbiont of Culicoides punctatus]|uniref:hypothetical protein n=1 Tax=Cardinium endosymbiont of Culicoides punctatus TaxID=2304601 RepID=UPI001058EA2B|nr:hypothetical protein [Cardinium endosymbiont of Culicoides punctatus]TDG95500.1 hypothetical protein CCPUN_03230 [Cardinium endosymbiont of Culicoides punctatus]